MKNEAIENASTDSLHAELDRQILELLRQMTPEHRAESVAHIRNTYSTEQAGR